MELISANLSPDVRWWREDDPFEAIWAALTTVVSEDQNRRSQILHYLRLYGNREVLNLMGSTHITPGAFWNERNYLRYNVVKSVIDTVASRIGKNRPKAAFLTSGGDFTQQRTARNLEKYVEGSFYETDIYDKGSHCFRDACIMGPGILKFFEKKTRDGGWKVWNERVFPWELLVDYADGRDGHPTQMFHVKHIDTNVIYEMFADSDKWKNKKEDLRNVIELAQQADWEGIDIDSLVDQKLCVESWHLPSGPDAKDGRHVISLSSAVLFEEEWDEDWFPFAVFQWSRPTIGYWGTGIAKDINGIQIEINRLLDKIQKSYHLFANPWVAVQVGSKVLKSHITNGVGRILEYQGQPPQVVTHQPIHPQVISYLQQLKTDALRQTGVSEMAAQGKKPADLESGAALREYNDIEDTRHAGPAQQYERFYMDSAKTIVRMSQRMHKQGKTPEVMAHYKRRSRKWVDVLKWSDINIDESGYVMQIFPTSLLPSTPAGRTATVQEWLRSGLVDKVTAMHLLELPDLEQVQTLEVTSYNIVLDQMESILEDGEFIHPEPYQDLLLALKLSQTTYLQAKMDKAPDDKLEMVRLYIEACKRLIDKQKMQEQNPQIPPNSPVAQAQDMPLPGVEGPPGDPQAAQLAAAQGAALQ